MGHNKYAFERTVRPVVLPYCVRHTRNMKALFDSLSDCKSRNFGNRKHALFGPKAGYAHWWGREGDMRPLLTTEFPPLLGKFTSRSVSEASEIDDLQTSLVCLPAIYDGCKSSLGWHSDNFLKNITGRGEEVLLIYLGATRKLQFRWKKNGGLKFFEDFILSCNEGDAFLLTPLANELFLHRKPPCAGASLSITLAYRFALSIASTVSYFPCMQRFFS